MTPYQKPGSWIEIMYDLEDNTDFQPIVSSYDRNPGRLSGGPRLLLYSNNEKLLENIEEIKK
jgi:hypothetical protein